MDKILGRDILRQLKKDLIGKDSYRGVTLSYSWLANQLGHFTLGFVPSLLLYKIIDEFSNVKEPALVASLTIFILWLLFEIVNVWVSVKGTSNKKRHIFPPLWRNIVFDTGTDLLFFFIGSFSAWLYFDFTYIGLTFLIVVFFIALLFSHFWYRTKMYLQEAQYPMQFRLSLYNIDIREEDKEKIECFIKNTNPTSHLLLYGGASSGKTSLAVGIATELSIKHQTCVYTTAVKFFSMFDQGDEDLRNKSDKLWTWRESKFLVIDDMNVDNPTKGHIVSSENFLKILEESNDLDKEVIKQKNIIWVLGDKHASKVKQQDWEKTLINIGVGHISSVNLS